MTWFKVFKFCSEFSQVWSNSYYLDLDIQTPRDSEDLLRQITSYDMSFHSDYVSHVMTVGCQAGGLDNISAVSNSCYNVSGAVQSGWRSVGKPLPWRFTWNWRASFSSGSMVRRFYRFALGDNDVTWNDLGDMVYVPDRLWLQDHADRVNTFCPLVVAHQVFARGVEVEGAAFVGERPLEVVSGGLTVTNALRRARARRLNEMRDGFEQLLGAASSILQSWYQFRSYWDLQLPDYYPSAVKEMASECAVGAKQMCQLIDSLAQKKIKSGDTLETVYYMDYGPTWAALSSRSSQLAEKMDKADIAIRKPLPFQGYDGDYYYHAGEASTMWEQIENIPAYIAPFLMLDWESTKTQGAAKEDMIDDYTPGWYDLDYNAGTIAPPPKKKRRRIAPTPLL